MLQAVLNKSKRQRPTNQQLYAPLPLISKTIHVRRTRHAGHCWRSKDELISDVLQWNLSRVDEQGLGDQREPINNISVLIQDIAWKTFAQSAGDVEYTDFAEG